MIIGIDQGRLEKFVNVIRKNIESIVSVKLDLFDNKFYPGKNVDQELVYRYFIVMVAIDHRLSRPGKPYEACIDNECFHGSDLLYRLGKLMFEQNPEFYDPVNLAEISRETVEKWLSIGEVKPPDLDVRVYLLRDLGLKLMKIYGGRVLEIFEKTMGRLRGDIVNPGLTDLLRVFRAYEDPVEKKSMLLTKFLTYRGLFKPIDTPDLPIDNHLTRIALRLGILMVSGDLWNKIRNGIEVTGEEDLLIRFFVRRAFRVVCERAGIDPFTLDDYLWNHGRRICVRDKPFCNKCLFKNICLGYSNEKFMVNEHFYYNTWFY